MYKNPNAFRLIGTILLTVKNKHGLITDERVIKNLITNAGFAGIASRINGAGSEALFDYIAVGTDNTAAAVTDTTLGAEISSGGLSRAQGTASRVTTTVTDDTAQISKDFSVSSSFAIVEAGLFNASSSGVMLARQVFSAVNVVSSDTFTVTWKIQAS
jgi:hypothetical protein